GSAAVPLTPDQNGVSAELRLEEGESAVFVLEELKAHARCGPLLSDAAADRLMRETIGYWRRWIAGCTYTGRWREMVHRSALALKLLTYAPTGAIVAAAPCGLPEGIGGERDWGYRDSRVRDAEVTS